LSVISSNCDDDDDDDDDDVTIITERQRSSTAAAEAIRLHRLFHDARLHQLAVDTRPQLRRLGRHRCQQTGYQSLAHTYKKLIRR